MNLNIKIVRFKPFLHSEFILRILCILFKYLNFTLNYIIINHLI